VQGRIGAQLHHRAHILQHHVAARALGEAVSHLLADDLVLALGEARGLGVGEVDDFHRHALGVEDSRVSPPSSLGVGRAGRRVCAATGRSGGGPPSLGTQLSPRLICADGHLHQPALGLPPEELALEPLELVLERCETLAQRVILAPQCFALSEHNTESFCANDVVASL